ncbi:MAG: tRNA lysidine(34) synthetase TilS, partial [Bacteroidetes bacterium]|nr:tRNA lysidine(34) synthetase TilS [Bacteroidota bacterium]
QSGKMVLSKTHRLINDRDYLLLTLNPIIEQNSYNTVYPIDEHQKLITTPIELKVSPVKSPDYQLNKLDSNSILVDKDLLKFPLLLRKWKKGDYFYPFGMEGTKKVSKFFKDEKYSIPHKENSWLLCSDNRIVWIIGKRADNRFRVTPQTTHVLKITVNEKIS